ncbi:MAG: histidine kinase [Thermodesulfovibrio sp.]|nr:histidine kinase [Thermodesulfovibrio sp.]
MIADEIIDFFRNVPPFQFLDEKSLSLVAGRITREFYPQGTMILRQDGPPGNHLSVIKKGGVKVFITSGGQEEIVIDYRGEGDSFGILSLVGEDKSRANVLAAEDTICYLVPRDLIFQLIDSNPAFTEFFLKSFFTKFIDKTYTEMQKRTSYYSGSDKLLFSTRVRDIGHSGVLTAAAEIPIQEAARMMTESRFSSLVLLDQAQKPAGVITDRDLRDKVVAMGRDVQEPASAIMSRELIMVAAEDFCFEALLKMIRHNIHHLLVFEGERLVGIITNHDFLLLQGTSPISIVKEIEGQVTVEGLVPVSRKINSVIGLLLKEGAGAANIIRIISEINDRLIYKVIDLAEKRLGPPPVRYSWIVCGSEGRHEQTFKTDQDNALIWEDLEDDAGSETAAYFASLAWLVNDGLARMGYPRCPAGYMAATPEWCQPLHIWKRYFTNWMRLPNPEAMLKALVFFDFRHLYGDPSLAEELRDHLGTLVAGNRLFLGNMAGTIIKNVPPLGFLKTFIVEKSGEHKNELNLKIKGITPLVDIVRLFSLEQGVRETSTFERLQAMKEGSSRIGDAADDIGQVLEFFLLLRIHNQFRQISTGKPPDNFMNPQELSNLEKKTMKEAFSLITALQGQIIERYKQMIL